MFQALADDGFTVIGVTANDLISPAYSLTRGFDVLLYRERKAAALRSRLTETLDEWKRGDLAIFVHSMDPHQPYVRRRRFVTASMRSTMVQSHKPTLKHS